MTGRSPTSLKFKQRCTQEKMHFIINSGLHDFTSHLNRTSCIELTPFIPCFARRRHPNVLGQSVKNQIIKFATVFIVGEVTLGQTESICFSMIPNALTSELAIVGTIDFNQVTPRVFPKMMLTIPLLLEVFPHFISYPVSWWLMFIPMISLVIPLTKDISLNFFMTYSQKLTKFGTHCSDGFIPC